jgi:Mlc titration factor MtfA (ptsG expression regulator)
MQIVRRSSIWSTLVIGVVVGAGGAVIAAEATTAGVWGAVAAGVIPAVVVLGVGLRRPLRRWRTARTSLPDGARRWLRCIPVYGRMSDAGRERFERDLKFVLDEYTFEGVQDVTVTDEHRLSVAAAVALLLHGRPTWELPGSSTVLFYPDRFDDDYYGGDYADYDGMAHEQGPIILSAPAVEDAWRHAGDGDNVVLHELAHLFDFDNEGPDGVPSLVDPASAASWQNLVRREMRRVRLGRSVLRPYAAEAPSEFFAVAVEHFFEEPDRLARRHADLFAALCAFFNLDPRDGSVPPEVDAPGRGAPSEEERENRGSRIED